MGFARRRHIAQTGRDLRVSGEAGVPTQGDQQTPELTGLTQAEVQQRIAEGKTNAYDDPRSRSVGSIIKENTLTSFNLVIGTMWALMFIARAPIQDSLFGFVIVFNSLIGIVQEIRAKRTLESLSLIGEAKPVVRRDGVAREVPPAELVLDDIVVLSTGDQVVVDGEVLTTHGLEIDESLLTGEADPVHKSPGDQAMSGSFVVSGSGVMRATAVGADSYATKLAAEAKKFSTTKSELMGSIMKFVRTITWVLVPLGILLFFSQLRAAPGWEEALAGTVAGIVTMVPEGLVLLTSVAMAVAVVRLGRKKALVQEMPAVETLARVDVVCVDKTGTLTEPGMAVTGYELCAGTDVSKEIAALALGALGRSEETPNPTLQAIANEYTVDEWDPVSTVPFSSARKWSAANFGTHGSWIMGAPEVIMAGSDNPAVDARAEELASGGSRVVLLAKSVGDSLPDSDKGIGAVEPVALVSINQRLRDDAADTVQYFLDQDVEVKVISGDNPVTVGAIATQAGIPHAEDPFDARQLPEDQEQLAEVLETHGVFGRVSPAQKRAMVSALQSRGHTVAMTGDGVNDVLALKDADLGIAMGSGAGATRAVAQIVLLDNKFSVMPSVVAEGRRVLGNIERVSSLFLTKSFYSAILSLITVVLTLTAIYEIEFIFLPRHLTLITFLTIGTPAFFLALMPNKQRFRPGFFGRVLRFAVPAGVVCALFSMASYLLVLSTGDTVFNARTAAAITLFIISWTVLVLVARPLNALRITIVIAMGLGFLIVLFVPWLSNFFALTLHLGVDGSWAMGLGVVGALLVIVIRRFVEAKYEIINEDQDD